MLGLTVLASLLFGATIASAASPVYTGYFSNAAISGYDAVAYHTDNKAIEGDDDYSFEWMGANWYFRSAANRDAFAANPEKYAPQYGGYCAYAVAMGGTASSDPHQWSIVRGKLYLNYDGNVQARWQKDREAFIQQANQNWPEVLN
ncbi:MAG: YHS domain-containing protein [Alphaproteobacteria bacterium]|nr:YHS domain-containing protein [Alphaproteobacteria bacterium]